MPSLLDDLRHGFRALRRNPVLSAVAVLSLAIGIGANTAIFTLMDRLLLRALPVRDPERLVLLRAPGGWNGRVETEYSDELSFSWPKYHAFQEQTAAVFESVIARFPFNAAIVARAETDRTRGELVSGNYFAALGVAPALGRTLDDGDARGAGNPVAVLSYSYWQSRFAGDPAILNRIVTVNSQPLTVVGVARAGFRSIGAGESPALFLPIPLADRVIPGWEGTDDPHSYWLNIFGRLRPGISRGNAEASLDVVWKRILAADVDRLVNPAARQRYLGKRLLLLPAATGISSIRDTFEAPLYLLMGMVGLVLLIACANVANLLLARAAAREKEMAIRVSLGAGRGRLIRHVLAESLILSTAGGALGLFVASWGGSVMLRLVPAGMPVDGISADPDGRVLAFTLGVSLLTGLLFGVAPALRATRPSLAPALRQQSASGQSAGHARFRQALVAGQIALSALLLASAGLLMHSLQNLRTLDPGFRAGGLTAFSINPRLVGYTPERAVRLEAELRQQFAALPGASGVAMAKWPLLTGAMDVSGFRLEGYQGPQDDRAAIGNNHVAPGFFGLMGIPLLTGREFRESDAAGAPPVAVINESCARKFFAGRSPVGLHLTARRLGAAPVEIVGIVKDAKYDDLREEPKPFVYIPALQDREAGPATFYVRSSVSLDALAPAMRETLRHLDSNVPMGRVEPVREQILDSVFADRMIASLSSAFALLATLLAAVGLYGVIAWAVSRRRREIGIRMALGAQPSNVLRMVLSEVLWLGGIGIALAVPLWIGAGRLLRSLLFGVTDRDPLTLALAVLLLAAVAAAAGFIPAWRASRIDPNLAIRYE
jgi:predicted permease